MHELQYKESRALKDWCFWTMVLKKTLESSLDGKEIKLEILKISRPDYSLERLMLKLKLQYFGLNAKSWFLGKDPDAGKDWRQEEKGTTEDEMADWYHWLDVHESEQVLGVGDGQGSLACCSPWGYKGLDSTERRNWTDTQVGVAGAQHHCPHLMRNSKRASLSRKDCD